MSDTTENLVEYYDFYLTADFKKNMLSFRYLLKIILLHNVVNMTNKEHII